MKEKISLGAIREFCTRGSELIPLSVLCNSIGTTSMRDPILASQCDTVSHCIALLAEHKAGSVVIVDESEQLIGIFTERDCVTKVLGHIENPDEVSIGTIMTKDPVCERPDTTIAFALNLMSHGGFRNLPIVDDDKHPIGVLSVKDIVDYLVSCMMSGLEGIETSAD